MNLKPFILLKWANPYQDLIAEGYLPLPFVIGRSRKADLILHSNTISRRHAVISLDSRGITYLRDLNSCNGTRVNGKRCMYAVLHNGDRISIGPYSLTVTRIAFESRLKRKVILQHFLNVMPDISTMPVIEAAV